MRAGNALHTSTHRDFVDCHSPDHEPAIMPATVRAAFASSYNCLRGSCLPHSARFTFRSFLGIINEDSGSHIGDRSTEPRANLSTRHPAGRAPFMTALVPCRKALSNTLCSFKSLLILQSSPVCGRCAPHPGASSTHLASHYFLRTLVGCLPKRNLGERDLHFTITQFHNVQATIVVSDTWRGKGPVTAGTMESQHNITGAIDRRRP